MTQLSLELNGLRFRNPGGGGEPAYRLSQITSRLWDWDSVVRGGHAVNCWYNKECLFNLYVKDGVVLREEQAAIYPPLNDPQVPDPNPRGCQKGVCYSHRMYDPTRLRYPLKRAGERGEGKWQRVSWDQALTEIADTLLDVLSTEGNEVILDVHGPQGKGSHAVSWMTLMNALGIPTYNSLPDQGDEHPGAALTWGKIAVHGSTDNWFYSDILLLWGSNPAYTQMANYHYISEARYNGTRVVAITPDYNPSCPFVDLWVPLRPGSDAALALSLAQVIVAQGLHNPDFLREQTDLPLLVRADTGKFLSQTDMEPGGRGNIFYLWDVSAQRAVEAPYRSLALDGVLPALEGEFEVTTLAGRVKVRPVFELLKERLQDYTPERASVITGVSPRIIRQLAEEFATAKGVVNLPSALWGKHYHGDLMQRAQILLWALCGHFGRKGSGYNAFSFLWLDTGLGTLVRRGTQAFLAAEATDPRFAQWREQGYTDEMILHEYQSEAAAQGGLSNLSLLYHLHAGLLEVVGKANSWDPDLKRPIEDYLNESLRRGWQVAVPPAGKELRVILERGGSFLRRSRNTGFIVDNLLPKLKLLVTVDFRMGSTALYSDYVLPAAGWYERYYVGNAQPECPYLHVHNKAVEPLGESKPDWSLSVMLAYKLQERARARGILSFTDRLGQERRLDNLYDQVTVQGLYLAEEEEAVTRDYFLNAANVETLDWEEYKNRGIAVTTGVGKVIPDSACDIVPGEPIIPLTWHTTGKQPYPTLTRRMQFYIDHDWFLELGEALPTHKDIPRMGGDYPLYLLSGHARWSIHSIWKDSPLLLRLQRGEPIMFMSVEDARARGLQDGNPVEVFNDVASIHIQAAVSPAVRPGVVIIYHDWENFQFPGKRFFKSLMPSPLNPVDLVGGYGHIRPRVWYHATPGSSDRGTRVEVRKAPLPAKQTGG